MKTKQQKEQRHQKYKIRKAEKAKARIKKFKRVRNILKNWKEEERNRREMGKKPRLMPINLPEKSRKFKEKKVKV